MNNCIKPSEDEFEIGSKVVYSQSELAFSQTQKQMSDSYLSALLYPYSTI